jgi:hypothetical protein
MVSALSLDSMLKFSLTFSFAFLVPAKYLALHTALVTCLICLVHNMLPTRSPGVLLSLLNQPQA